MNAAELFKHYAEESLSQYRSHFQCVNKILKAGELPDARSPEVQVHLKELKNFLAGKGICGVDEFLLRVGLTVPGSIRGIHPPIDVLKSERGGFSKQRLEEAAGQAERLHQAISFAREMFPEISQDVEKALNELLLRPKPIAISDQAWVRFHSELQPEDAEQLSTRAIRCLDSTFETFREIGISVMQTLAGCREDGLENKTALLLDRAIIWPPSLFRAAPEDIARRLVEKIENADGLVALNHLLLALAWTRGETAHDSFLKWKTLAPDWTTELHVPVQDYMQDAGWMLDNDGRSQELISTSCHLIVKSPAGSDANLSVPCRIPAGSNCPNCGGALSWLFDFLALPNKYFSDDRKRAPRKVLCCLNCACFNPVFSRYCVDGTAELHSASKSAGVASTGEWPSCECRIGTLPFPPFAAANPFHLNDASTLGGIPMWLQDSQYPRCPDCAMPMRFLAQFYNLAMPQPEEGIFYAFFCQLCSVAAVNYQQT